MIVRQCRGYPCTYFVINFGIIYICVDLYTLYLLFLSLYTLLWLFMLLKVRPVVVQEVSAFLVNTKTLTGIIPSHAMHVNIKNERCMTLCREDGLVPVVNRQSMKSLRAFKNETTLLNKMTSVNGLVDFCQLQTNIMEDIRT